MVKKATSQKSTAKEKIRLELSPDRVDELVSKLESSNLSSKDAETIKNALWALLELDLLIGLRETTIARLRKIFGKKLEKRQKLSEEDSNSGNTEKPKENTEESSADNSPSSQDKNPAKGNGKHGQDMYAAADTESHPLQEVSSGDSCPECSLGKLYRVNPGVHIRVTGSSPLMVTVHRTEKLRCNRCDAIFEADFPEKNKEKYDASAKAIIAVMHYHSSLPFYRLEKLQKNFGLPIPRSTMWGEMEKLANRVVPIWRYMTKYAAEQNLMHVDDTTARVYSLLRENELNKGSRSSRKGMFTTGILSKGEDHSMIMYFTGRKYAGENLQRLIKKRETKAGFILMSDALGQNVPKETAHEIIQSLCLVHGRRQFFDLQEEFDQEVNFVLNQIGTVYGNDKICKEKKYSDLERLSFHQEHSKPAMDHLKQWLDCCFTEHKVEPNSNLGRAVKYMKKHWKGLTAFLRQAGAPLDNNVLERQLRVAVLNRKNWLFYRNTLGAFVGDILLSLIKTCEINGINSFEYLRDLYDHSHQAADQPSMWMPWNYKDMLPVK